MPRDSNKALLRGPGALVCLLAGALLNAQQPEGSGSVFRIGPGVTPPRLLRKVEPEYSPAARAERVQGTLVLQVVVDEQGRATDITVLSPLGFGLDERAEEAVQKWEFTPGSKDGRPVKILANVQVNFRFPGHWFDEKAERRRTSFNVAVQNLSRTDASLASIGRAMKSIQDLCNKKYPPAMYLAGLWELTGERVPRNPEGGLALIHAAAARNYGPALYEVGVRRIEGRDLPQDAGKGFQEMREAATLGSSQAQFYLGNAYEKGSGVPREIDRARRYFRLCATQGVALCQYRLAVLLFHQPDRPERDYVQALALFQLAAEQNLPEAREVASAETPNLTPEQIKWVNTLKDELVRK